MSNKFFEKNILILSIRYVISTVLSVLIFSYLSRTLTIESFGIYNFSITYVNYFILLSGSGIIAYSIREGSRIKNEDKVSSFISQMFSLNLLFSLVCFTLLMFSVLLFSSFEKYRIVIIIYSFLIFSKLISVEWIYSIYEKYLYINVRNLIAQLIYLLLIIFLVKDMYQLIYLSSIYTIILLIFGIINFIYARKIVSFNITFKFDFGKHLVPILMIFVTSIAATIYVNLDITLLGLMTDENNVGIYSVAVKFYTILKSIISVIIIISIPRLSSLIEENYDAFNRQLKKTFDIITLILVPVSIGLFMTSENIVIITSSDKYLQSGQVLKVLAISLLFSMLAAYYGQSILLSLKKEKQLMIITTTSAILNLVLNLVFIPTYGIFAAAYTTLFSEFIALLLSYILVSKLIHLKKSMNLNKVVFGSLIIIPINIVFNYFIYDIYLNVVLTVIISFIAYLFLQIKFKNDYVISFIKKNKNIIMEQK